MCGLSWQPLLCEVRSSRRGASRAASVASRAASVASAAVELRASPGPAAVGFRETRLQGRVRNHP